MKLSPAPLLVTIGTLTLAAAVTPLAWLAWRIGPARSLEVVIADKTAASGGNGQGATIPWLLHALKIEDRKGRFIDSERQPIDTDPARRRVDFLTDDVLADADVLFVKDTYAADGADDPPAANKGAADVGFGVTDGEARAIESFAKAHRGMVLAELGAFASQRDDDARRRLEDVFGVRWTGWVARYWPNLGDAKEVPPWIGDLYEQVSGRRFDFHGGGLVFVRDEREIVVLGEGEDMGPGAVTQQRTAGGGLFGFPERGAFSDWMDVIDSTGSEVIYDYVVEATPAGASKLAAHGLAARFPAVTRRWNAWYFAGEFDAAGLDLGSPERAWLIPFRGAVAGCVGGGGRARAASFWGWYAPIVSRLLALRAK